MRGVRLTLAAACAASLVVAAPAAAKHKDSGSEKLRRAVTVKGLLEHQRNLQAIADMNGGTRTTGTPGYEASADYVVARLEKAGYNVRREPFNLPDWQENSPPQLTAAGQTWTPGTEADNNTPASTSSRSASRGQATPAWLPVVPVTNLVEPPTPAPSSSAGCAAEDYPAATEGAISLIQRGTCPFVQKLRARRGCGGDRRDPLQRGQPGPDERAVHRGAAGLPDPGRAHLLRGRPRAAHHAEPDRADRRRRDHDAALLRQRDRREPQGRPPQEGHARRAPRLGRGRSGDQRQRLGHGHAAGDRGAARQAARQARPTRSPSRSGAPRRTGSSARPTSSST